MPENHPNVLLVCTDHWPGSLLGCAGHPSILTPTLDQLAVNGCRFPNAYSECPVCVPARRTLMSGLSPHSHGVLQNQGRGFPQVTPMAQAFSDAGYQTTAVGKMHVHPARQRLGFDDILLDEEGRCAGSGWADDYELFLRDHGHTGERFAGGMCNNNYMWRSWHLDERLHVTNWAAREMSRQIVRRDPLRPGFWYLSFSHPHPPLAPLQAYLDLYRDVNVPDPFIGEWADRPLDELDVAIQRDRQSQLNRAERFTIEQIRDIRRAFYALCTHIDHQLRVVIGTLREEGLLGETIICFTSDHGDMLGNHHFWAKHWMYEDSARVPMILVGADRHKGSGEVGHHRVDERLVGLRDIMPTLLDLAGVPVPGHCEGRSMTGGEPREHTFGAFGGVEGAENGNPSRMIRDPRFKLIYYPAGNLVQLFDMEEDPCEMRNLAADPAHEATVARLADILVKEMPKEECGAWVTDGKLTGRPDAEPAEPGPNGWFSGQYGIQKN